ncbi:MAG: alanine--tRNA ligase [Dehalococcoidales bacterium]|nr:alanine--tRNA ligase [Dehalococcoidales bacterium]
MTSDEIRASFLSFFESKGHSIIPSSSLIPQGDPTLLLTTAGMVQFKPYFLGLETPPNPKLTTCQKCFRTTDIDSVGDPTHLTFFEMLGNFSIGDYFKKEAIAWAWEYVTKHLKMPPEKLWITIFLDDDEAFHIWRNIGVPESRIVRLGEASNFWGPAGDSGPCGPCSEIHYDLGPKAKCEADKCVPGCDCGRYVEIWNLVFTQYNQDKNGKRTNLPKPNIDTGMGLERLTVIMQNKKSVYETTIFAPLLQHIGSLCGKKYGDDANTDLLIRVVAEHSRGIAFLIGDGVQPSNEGRGYVLRRLLRRAVLFGRRLGLEKAFLAEIAGVTIKQMGHVYPELKKREEVILKIIEMEEAKFSETLSIGLELLGKVMDEASGKKTKKISGAEAFKLYDTYGFPVDLTAVIAKERGFTVDIKGFEAEMEKQRERARASQKFETAEGAGVSRALDIKATNFVGYGTLTQESTILGILVKDKAVSEVELDQEAGIILESTPFYGEMGGQVGDTGEIRGSRGRFIVTDTVRLRDKIVHRGKVVEGVLPVGDKVTAAIDEERRRDIQRNHTATHLLHMALRQVIGEHVEQRGSQVAPDRFTFDFSHLTVLTPEELQKVQRLVNDVVRRDLPVTAEEMPYKEAIKGGVIALFGEKYGEKVRVLRVGQPPVSAELCGGTHVSATGEIGFLHILNEHSVGAGLRRIEGVTGRYAEAAMEKLVSDLRSVAGSVDTSTENVVDKVCGKVAECEMEHRRAEGYEKELAKIESDSLVNKVEVINGIKVLAVRVSSRHTDVLRDMSDMLREKLGSAIIVLGTVYEDKPAFVASVTPDLVAKGFDAGKIVREVAKIAGGGGGGKPNLAQGSGKDKSQIDSALRVVAKLVQDHK